MKFGILLAAALVIVPITARASVFSVVLAELSQVFGSPKQSSSSEVVNSQNIPILQATRTYDLESAQGGGDITVVGGTALLPDSGPNGTMVDVADTPGSSSISTYVVRKGDTLGSIARMFDVSVNTVRWANDLSGSIIHENQVLVILPISGVRHTVVKGDTLASIAKKYKADTAEIARYNSIEPTDKLVLGDIIMVPDGEVATPKPVIAAGSNPYRGGSGPLYSGYYLRPILGGTKTQGLHGYNAVDLATYRGAPVFASAEGDVIISAGSGWNGGYGQYVVIAHQNGTQTLYAHLSKNLVSPGDHVTRGQQIGLVGTTGKSTGPHVHFEVRGAANPF